MMIDCDVKVVQGKYDLVVIGRFTEHVQSPIRFYAPSPADYRASFPGSALPYASERQAFEGSPNIGSAVVDEENKFEIRLLKPNAYFIVDERTDPYVNIIYIHAGEEKTLRVNLGEAVKYRTLQSQRFEFDESANTLVETQEKLLKRRRFC